MKKRLYNQKSNAVKRKKGVTCLKKNSKQKIEAINLSLDLDDSVVTVKRNDVSGSFINLFTDIWSKIYWYFSSVFF